jgi:hypothetical protein
VTFTVDSYRCLSSLQYRGTSTRNVNVTGKIHDIKLETSQGGAYYSAKVAVYYGNNQRKAETVGSATTPYFWEASPSCAGKGWDNKIVSLKSLSVTNNDNPSDNCGNPAPPQTEPYWEPDNPNYQPPSVDVNLDLPNFYPSDFPDINVDLQFNTDLTIGGDNFTMNFDGDDIVMNYDSDSPPPFIENNNSGNRSPGGGRVECASGGDLTLPDRFDFSLPELLGDLWDKIDDYIPTPVPGISVGDLLNLLAEILDNTENGGEEIDILKLPYYDCEGQQFAEVPIEAVRSSIENFPLDKFTEAANATKLWCDEPTLIAGVPEWWSIRPGANRPQIVVSFRRDGERSYGILTIPHYHSVPQVGSKPLSSYRAGNVMGRERLIDNSQLIVNCESANEAERMLNEMAGWVRSDMRSSPPNRTYQERQGNSVKVGNRAPKKVMIFPEGRSGSMKPSIQWKIEPNQLM